MRCFVNEERTDHVLEVRHMGISEVKGQSLSYATNAENKTSSRLNSVNASRWGFFFHFHQTSYTPGHMVKSLALFLVKAYSGV